MLEYYVLLISNTDKKNYSDKKKKFMNFKLCVVYTCDFWKRKDEHKHVIGEISFRSVTFILCGPPYIIRRDFGHKMFPKAGFRTRYEIFIHIYVESIAYWRSWKLIFFRNVVSST